MLSGNQKWMLDNSNAEEQAVRRAGIAQQTPVRVRLELVDEASPTCANTAKPHGVKKARILKAALAAQAIEEKELESRLSDWVEHYGRWAEIGKASNEVASERNKKFQVAQDDFMLLRDTSRMNPQVLQVFLMALQEAMVRIVARCRLAKENEIAAAKAA